MRALLSFFPHVLLLCSCSSGLVTATMAVPFVSSSLMAVSFRGASGEQGGEQEYEPLPLLLEQQLRRFPLWGGRRSKWVDTGDLMPPALRARGSRVCAGARLLLAPTPGNSPLLHFKVGFFLLSQSQQRLKAASSFKGNLQKPANLHHFFRPQVGNLLASALEFFWVGRGECCLFVFVVRNSVLGGESWCRWYLG